MSNLGPNKIYGYCGEQQVAKSLLEIIRSKDLVLFQHTIGDLNINPKLLIAAMNSVAKEINCNELTVPPPPLLQYKGLDGKIKETTVIAFRLNTARRLLVISPQYKLETYGPDDSKSDGPLSTLLFDSPEVLFKQVGSIASMPRVPLPPPMHQSVF